MERRGGKGGEGYKGRKLSAFRPMGLAKRQNTTFFYIRRCDSLGFTLGVHFTGMVFFISRFFSFT